MFGVVEFVKKKLQVIGLIEQKNFNKIIARELVIYICLIGKNSIKAVISPYDCYVYGNCPACRKE